MSLGKDDWSHLTYQDRYTTGSRSAGESVTIREASADHSSVQTLTDCVYLLTKFQQNHYALSVINVTLTFGHLHRNTLAHEGQGIEWMLLEMWWEPWWTVIIHRWCNCLHHVHLKLSRFFKLFLNIFSSIFSFLRVLNIALHFLLYTYRLFQNIIHNQFKLISSGALLLLP